MDNVDYPPNKYGANYDDPIEGVEDHEEDPHHEYNTDGLNQGHPPATHKQYPPETQDAPISEQKMPIDTQTTKDQENFRRMR